MVRTAETSPGLDVGLWGRDDGAAMASRLTSADLARAEPPQSRPVHGAELLDAIDGWLTPAVRRVPAPRPGGLQLEDVEAVELAARTFRAWNRRATGGLHRKAVLGQLNVVAAHLREHQAPEVEERLHRVVADLAGTAATMAWDSGRHHNAQQYYLLALRSSHAVGDVAYGAKILSGMARQMLYGGRPGEALEMIRLAQEGTRHTAGPRLRAMLEVREAWAYAATGRAAAFRRKADDAHETLSAAGPDDGEPAWIAYFDEAELRGTVGGRLLELAHHDPARHAEAAVVEISAALKQRGPEAGRSHALDRIGLAECHYLLGDLTTAVEETHRAVDVAVASRSYRVRDKLAGLYACIPDGGAAAVRDARERVRAALAG